jgi:hypothetical protein
MYAVLSYLPGASSSQDHLAEPTALVLLHSFASCIFWDCTENEGGYSRETASIKLQCNLRVNLALHDAFEFCSRFPQGLRLS